MKLFYFAGNDKPLSAGLLDIIEACTSPESIFVHTSVNSLAARLRRFYADSIMIVILTTTVGELMDIVAIKELLQDLPILLILPDNKKETISKGTTLHPRFISYLQDDFTEVESVMRKMVKRYSV